MRAIRASSSLHTVELGTVEQAGCRNTSEGQQLSAKVARSRTVSCVRQAMTTPTRWAPAIGKRLELHHHSSTGLSSDALGPNVSSRMGRLAGPQALPAKQQQN